MSEPVKYNDYPFEDVTEKVLEQLKENPKLRFFQKFTCANCGQRLTMEEPNHFYKEGGCDKCGHVTNIEKQGCNYLLFASPDPTQFDAMLKKIKERGNGK